MAVPAHLLLKNDGGVMIRGGSDVQGRGGSAKLRGLVRNLSVPTGGATEELTGIRQHSPFLFDGGIDPSSPYLYRTVATDQTLQNVEPEFYHINGAGQEVKYFNTLLEGVKVMSVTPIVHDTHMTTGTGHLESVQLHYERIT